MRKGVLFVLGGFVLSSRPCKRQAVGYLTVPSSYCFVIQREMAPVIETEG